MAEIISNVDNPLALGALIIIVIGVLFKGVFQFSSVDSNNSYKLINKIINFLFLICIITLAIYAYNLIYKEKASAKTNNVKKEIIEEKEKKINTKKLNDTKKVSSEQNIKKISVLLSYPKEMVGSSILVDDDEIDIASNRTTRIDLQASKIKQKISLENERMTCTVFEQIIKNNQQISFSFTNCIQKN